MYLSVTGNAYPKQQVFEQYMAIPTWKNAESAGMKMIVGIFQALMHKYSDV